MESVTSAADSDRVFVDPDAWWSSVASSPPASSTGSGRGFRGTVSASAGDEEWAEDGTSDRWLTRGMRTMAGSMDGDDGDGDEAAFTVRIRFDIQSGFATQAITRAAPVFM